MSNIDKIKLQAQREANRSGRIMCVVNLNTFSPLYVCREWDPAWEGDKSIVVLAYPSTIDQAP